MSIETQGPFKTVEPNLEVERARAFSRMLNTASTIVSTQPSIKQQYLQNPPNEIPFFKTDGVKGGFKAQQLQPFDRLLLDDVVGNLFIENKNLINRRMNPFLTSGDLSAMDIARQV